MLRVQTIPHHTVLIADDQEVIRSLVARVLRQCGHQVIESSDGLDAIERFDSLRPDWVIMDIEMPRMDGLSATCAILRAHPAARIVIITQHDSEAFREAASEAGALAFLAKDELHRMPGVLADLSQEPRLQFPPKTA